jgi:hypothetical protein
MIVELGVELGAEAGLPEAGSHRSLHGGADDLRMLPENLRIPTIRRSRTDQNGGHGQSEADARDERCDDIAIEADPKGPREVETEHQTGPATVGHGVFQYVQIATRF